ncbi:MAG: phosphonoacetaldehyde hydrolase [Planctomycetaceae bacterium]|jgi:phosphonoacetaldehyde hydrolase|nr:phosphonoacetaldehyde hydrolase [Planctomycetaceae bacterium]
MKELPSNMTKLMIFDMAGTIIDHGCFAPISAFVQAFASMDVEISVPEARGPMGLHKRDHIQTLLENPNIANRWESAQGRAWIDDDVQHIYDTFMPMQIKVAREHVDIIPGVLELFESLRSRNIKIAATTGYPRVVADPVWEDLAAAGLSVDFRACSDEVPNGRPAPWLIFKCMQELNIQSVVDVVKVGDTMPDVLAGLNAGVRSVAITLTGNDVGLTYDELQALSEDERNEKHESAKSVFLAGGATDVIRSVGESLQVIGGSI